MPIDIGVGHKLYTSDGEWYADIVKETNSSWEIYTKFDRKYPFTKETLEEAYVNGTFVVK